MRVADARRLRSESHLIVAQEGQLLGLIPEVALHQARPDLELRDIMDDPVFLSPAQDLAQAAPLINHHAGTALPVVDARNRVIGAISATDLKPRPLI
jgi:Mg/Co/Ni transporter MgtE